MCLRSRGTRGRTRGWGRPCGWQRRRAAGSHWLSFRNLDEHVLPFDAHGVGGCRNDGREAGDLAGDEVEARAVLRALDVHAPELAVAKRELLMRADIVERVEVAVLGVRETDRRAS